MGTLKLSLIALIIVFYITGCASSKSAPFQNPGPPPAVADTATGQQDGSTLDNDNKVTWPDIPPTTVNSKLEVKGHVASNQKLWINNQEIQPGADGSYTFPVDLQPGENKIDLKVYNSASLLIAQQTKTVKLQIPPQLTILNPANNSGTSDQPVFNIKGLTSPENTLYLNGEKVLIQPDGSFSRPVTLKPGSNEIQYLVTSKDGQKREGKLIITFNPPVPNLYLEAPQYNSSVSGQTNSLTLIGLTEPYNLVQVFVNGDDVNTSMKSIAYEGKVDASGKFTVTVNLSQGDNYIRVIVTNSYGKTKSKDLRINGKQPPSNNTGHGGW